MDANKDTYLTPTHGWTCFHCGETFKIEVQARGHFGSAVKGEAICVMRAGAVDRFPRTEWPLMYRLRELEAEIEKMRQQLARSQTRFDRSYTLAVASLGPGDSNG